MFALAFAEYLFAVLPLVRRELRRWQRWAEQVPDPVLREQALAALREKRSNSEAVAVFAILAPWRRRRATVGAIVALQAAIDYLDVLGEGPCQEPLRDGLQLHQALAAAVGEGAPERDWYRLHPHRDDGGYLSRLVATSRGYLQALPGIDVVRPRLVRAAKRCGEGQSRTHAAGHGDLTALESWACALATPSGYRWWEAAAGASSSVAAHALIAAAAGEDVDDVTAGLIDAAYYPPVGALTVLLDDVVDRNEDAARSEHNYTTYYSSGEQAATRLAAIVADATDALSLLPAARRHAAILDGVLAFYLGTTSGRDPFALPIRTRLLEARAARVVVIAAFVGLQQRRKRSGGNGSASGPSAPLDRSAREEGGRPGPGQVPRCR